MKVLLDTQSLLWWSLAPSYLSKKAKKTILESEKIFFSLASFWELAIKANKKNHNLPLETEDLKLFLKQSKVNGLLELGITAPYFFGSTSLPRYHLDPFDRLIIATARNENLTLISKDRHFQKYDVPIIW